jgi:hypothetical protein
MDLRGDCDRRGVKAQEAEIARALQAQRRQLLRAAAARSDARGLPEDLVEELVDEAICTVVLMRKPIASEEHLIGAFWTAVRLLLCHHREGRRRIRVGARACVDFESAAVHAAAYDPTPDEVVELKDRLTRAADFMAQLSELERRGRHGDGRSRDGDQAHGAHPRPAGKDRQGCGALCRGKARPRRHDRGRGADVRISPASDRGSRTRHGARGGRADGSSAPGAWGAFTRSSCGGSFVLVDQTAE